MTFPSGRVGGTERTELSGNLQEMRRRRAYATPGGGWSPLLIGGGLQGLLSAAVAGARAKSPVPLSANLW